MSLRQRFQDDMKTAMREKQPLRLSTVRMILAKLKEKDIEARPAGNTDGISDADILRMLEGMIKQRAESAEMYRKVGSIEAAVKEEEEVALIQGYMPKALSADESAAVIAALVRELGAASIKDMGKVMNELRSRFAGQMDMAKAGELVKKALSGQAA